jgi:hypothetical protein
MHDKAYKSKVHSKNICTVKTKIVVVRLVKSLVILIPIARSVSMIF